MAENASLSNKSIFFELIEGNAEDSPGDSEPGSDIDFEDYNDNSFMPNFNELDNENGGRDADNFSHNELIETFAHVRVDTDAVDEPHGKVIVLDHPDDGWKNEITRPQEKRFRMVNRCGPKVTLDGLDETELFQLFFDAPVFEHIVRETNRNYAAQPDKHKSTWTDLTVDELKTFLGIIVAIGLVQVKGSLKTIWSNAHRLTAMPGVAEVFPRDIFLQIIRYLHFSEERNAPVRDNNPQYDIYYKVRYLFETIVPNFRNVYQAERQVSVDESMIKSQGRTPGRHFFPNKPIRFGMKIYMLAEAKSGYILNIDIAQTDHNVAAGQKITQVVMKICAPYHDLGYQLFMDNWYTSFALCVKLWRRGWHCCGTLRANRGGPKSITNKKANVVKKMKRADTVFLRSTTEELVCVSWKDNKLVSVLCSLPLADEMDTTIRKMKVKGKWKAVEVNRPKIIGVYNEFMGGVDLADKKIMTYKKHLKGIRWPLKVFWYFVDVCITNAYILYQCKTPKEQQVTLRVFREKLSTGLVGGRSYCKRRQPNVADADDNYLESVRFNKVLNHAPLLHTLPARCQVHQQRCDTKYSCQACGVRMCPYPCYARWHFRVDYNYNDPAKQGKSDARKRKRKDHTTSSLNSFTTPSTPSPLL